MMAGPGSVVVIGGTSGIGREVARFFADRGREVVISSREAGRARDVASEIGGRTAGMSATVRIGAPSPRRCSMESGLVRPPGGS